MANDANELLAGPNVSGYHIAEWLLWNAWRLRWEAHPDGRGRGWAFAHSLSSIGAGYHWPNIEISSDGVLANVASSQTIDLAAGPYRYVGAKAPEVVAASALEDAIRGFAEAVIRLLDDHDVVDTNLHRLWRDVERERGDPAAARLRRLEARLGYDPDEMPAAVYRSTEDAARGFGDEAVEELAADAGRQGETKIPSVRELSTAAEQVGMEMRPQDAANLRVDAGAAGDAAWGEVVAWRIGAAAARSLRRQEAIASQSIGNRRLAELAGAPKAALDETAVLQRPLSFMLATKGRARVALCSQWETGRRFDLARLLGDRLLGHAEPLAPATRAHTYRQKAQRAFAAELLCPYRAVCDFLGNDRSEERCEDAASHFNVSAWAVGWQLRNNDPSLRNQAAAW